jgi:hypothetical protein
VDFYYPDALDFADAHPISVAPGQDISGLNVTVRRRTVSAACFKVAGAEGKPVGVRLNRHEGELTNELLTVPPAERRAIELQELPEGRYSLLLFTVGEGQPRRAAMHFFTVGKRAVRDTILLQPGTDVAVEISAGKSDEQFKKDGHAAKIQFSLEPASRLKFMGEAPVKFSAAGVAALPGVLCGPYTARVSGLPPDHYVEAIRVGSADMLRGFVEVCGAVGQPRIVVELRPNAVTVAGHVETERWPEGRVTVFLIPEDLPEFFHERLVRSAEVGRNRQFLFRAVKPGDYRVALSLGLPMGEETNPAALARIATGAKKLKIGPGETANVTLPLP